MRFLVVALACGLQWLCAANAHADNAALQRLLQKNNCTACHLIDKKKYGPKLTEVAAKYAGDPAAVEHLMAKIRAGGSGVWGPDIMPPQAHVSDEDARAIAEYVLSLQ